MAKEFLRHFENNCTFVRYVNKHYTKDFNSEQYRPGTTINIPLPARFTATSGPVASFPSLTETNVSLTVQQWNTSFAPLSIEMTTSVMRDQWSERYIRPMAIALANQIDASGLATAQSTVFNATGVPGTTPSQLLTYLTGKAISKEQSAPVDDKQSIIINPAAEAVIVDNLKGLFHSSGDIEQQYKEGKMGMVIGSKWSMDQNVAVRTVGAQGGTPTVNGANQTGTSLVTHGWSNSVSGLLNVGDVFTIAGVFSVNPISKASTGRLQTFTVTATAASDGSGNSTLSILPSISNSGTTQNVSGSPGNGAAIAVLGTAGATAADNIAFHEDAFTFVCIPMATYGGLDKSAIEYDPDTGLAVRITQGMDVTNDKLLCRADVLFGWATPRPEWACRIMG